MASIELRTTAIKSSDGVSATVAEMHGSLDSSTLRQFQKLMDKLIDHGVQNLVLDCANVKYVTSTGMGTLLKYADTFEGLGGHIGFCRVPSKVMLVMEMLGFNALFNIATDESGALRSMARKLAIPSPAAMMTAPAGDTGSNIAANATPRATGSDVADRAIAGDTGSNIAASATPAPDSCFPLQTSCTHCQVTLNIETQGKYKCPRCGAVFSAEADGRVRFYALKKGRPIFISLPTSPVMAQNAGKLAGKSAHSIGFKDQAVESVSDAVSAACKNVIEHAYGNDSLNSFHVLIVENKASLTVKIADYGKTFDFGPGGSIQGDKRFADVVSAMDSVEHHSNPRGGNLVTMIKILK